MSKSANSLFTLVAVTIFSLFTVSCQELDAETSCDPANNSDCVCTENVTKDVCVKDSYNCTCRDTSVVATNNTNTNSNSNNATTNTLTDVMEIEPSPTSTTLTGDSSEKRGWICLDDRLEPRNGISLKNGLSDPCGINNVVAVFSEVSADKSYFHIVTTGIFTVTSNSAGEVGEWLQRGKNTLRIPVGSSVNLGLDSVVLGQDRYRTEFELITSVEGSTVTFSIPSMTVSKI